MRWRSIGARVSRRAQEAKSSGLITASQLCKIIGMGCRVDDLDKLAELSDAAIRSEWHHSGWDWKETNFYEYPNEEQIAELKRYQKMLKTGTSIEEILIQKTHEAAMREASAPEKGFRAGTRIDPIDVYAEMMELFPVEEKRIVRAYELKSGRVQYYTIGKYLKMMIPPERELAELGITKQEVIAALKPFGWSILKYEGGQTSYGYLQKGQTYAILDSRVEIPEE